MSDELIDAETPAVPVTKKGLSPASILGLLLLLVVLGAGIYVGMFWLSHNSRTSRLKAKNGDFVQLEHRGDVDEFAPPEPRRRRGDEDAADEPEAKKEPAEPTWYDQYMTEMFPKPIQIVYWRDPALTDSDVNLLMEFSDLEVLSVSCEAIKPEAIEKLLSLPKLRRLNITSPGLDASTIASWKADPKFSFLTLVCSKWSSEQIKEIMANVESNPALKDKVTAVSVLRPTFGGA